MVDTQWDPFDGLRPIENCHLAQNCHDCESGPGELCQLKQPRWSTQKFHTSRIKNGNARYATDMHRAPALEDRVPGVCYSTI